MRVHLPFSGDAHDPFVEMGNRLRFWSEVSNIPSERRKLCLNEDIDSVRPNHKRPKGIL